jgi:hypothetical protein
VSFVFSLRWIDYSWISLSWGKKIQNHVLLYLHTHIFTFLSGTNYYLHILLSYQGMNYLHVPIEKGKRNQRCDASCNQNNRPPIIDTQPVHVKV